MGTKSEKVYKISTKMKGGNLMNVQDRISDLLKEQEMLVKQYNDLSQQLQNIMTRLVQIQGALNELQKLAQEQSQVNGTETGQNITV